MKSILITGGAGFIGSHLVDKLLSEKCWRVTVVDDFNDFYDPALKYRNVEPHFNDSAFNLVKADIRSSNQLEKIFKTNRFDCIVHLAARAGVQPSLYEPQLYEETNIKGTLNLLEMARNYAVEQFVFGSSSSVYGENARIPFCEEAAANRPISPYAMTKAAGELLCYTYAHLYKIRCVCLRFFTVYGARQRPDLAIHKFAKLIDAGKPITVFGDGTTRRDYTYIDDIIAGVRAAIDYRRSLYEIINLGESRTVKLRELIALLERELDRKAEIRRLPAQYGDVSQTCADVSKARRLLDYNPQTQIELGIERFVKWFKENKADSPTQFKNYKNRNAAAVRTLPAFDSKRVYDRIF